MLRYALIFLVLALVLGIVGFGGFVTGVLLTVSKVFFALFVIAFIVSLFTGRNPVDTSL